MTNRLSALQEARAGYQPKLPAVLRNGANQVSLTEGENQYPAYDQETLEGLFPNTYGLPIITFEEGSSAGQAAFKVGVILSGGQAPGGHNVIAGLYDGLKSLNPANELLGFKGGPQGLMDNDFVTFTDEFINDYRNTGGFDIIGSGRTKLEEEEQFDLVAANCEKEGVAALVIIGGDDSNTNACVLAEYYAGKNVPIKVVGCPKTIDGDLKNEFIETSFGFDTATKVYSELIGNIQRDANSAKKYYHFIRVMGRSASHIALECALQTQPNMCLISEEIEKDGLTLEQVAEQITDVVVKRAAKDLNFGVILIPEGIIEFVPAMKTLIGELNDLLAHGKTAEEFLGAQDEVALEALGLTAASAASFISIPPAIRKQFVMDRDPHGNVQVSLIESEKMLIEMVKRQLDVKKAAGEYNGKFASQNHFFGYEGRCAAPNNFDADYCYSLGYTAAALLGAGKTGYLSSVRNLTQGADNWIAGGIPVTSMMNIERRHGHDKPVIKKALVELDGSPFQTFVANRDQWAAENCYVYPGPIQYFGPAEVCDQTTITIQLEQN
ncbi:MAG: diphosphate--fructose-6-phosphate 1-phosphotransferase [Lentisphaeria bacterium]|nr:diphosphate--fructose-6-phosphate 1-phosphotransferase [Lentisphaeria bacterium]